MILKKHGMEVEVMFGSGDDDLSAHFQNQILKISDI